MHCALDSISSPRPLPSLPLPSLAFHSLSVSFGITYAVTVKRELVFSSMNPSHVCCPKWGEMAKTRRSICRMQRGRKYAKEPNASINAECDTCSTTERNVLKKFYCVNADRDGDSVCEWDSKPHVSRVLPLCLFHLALSTFAPFELIMLGWPLKITAKQVKKG